MTNSENKYQRYSYSYPHKSAYREIFPISIADAWKKEQLDQLFFYVHLPFCEMRCGFCNLFTIANPKLELSKYIDAVEREMQAYQEQLPAYSFTNFAIGGGTPTFLPPDLLERLFHLMSSFGVDAKKYYGSIETSPKTLSPEHLALIEQAGIARVSMGIQSWIQDEVKALGRPQAIEETEKAVKRLASSNVPEFNLDLIYGANGQTMDSFLYSLEKTIDFQPTEIFLYPLYVRQLTGLSKKEQEKDIRFSIYLKAKEHLLANGYQQVSMRCFRRPVLAMHQFKHNAAQDGMIGLGSGARSYTRNLHYSSDYAVGRKEIKSIINHYIDAEFGSIAHGIYLSEQEQKRRFLIKSLFDGGKGIKTANYRNRFQTDVCSDFSLINEWLENGFLQEKESTYSLTSSGMDHEDYLSPILYSAEVNQKMENYEWK